MQMNNDLPIFDEADVSKNKVLVIVSLVFGILFFLPLVSCPDSQYGRFYANQGLLLFILGIVCSIIPIIGWLCSIAYLVFWIMVLVGACQGRAVRAPLIGGIEIIK